MKYKWRKPTYLKKPGNWSEYELEIHSEFLLINMDNITRKLYWNDIKEIRLFKVNPKCTFIEIKGIDKNQDILFGNYYALTFKNVERLNHEFNDFVVSIHRKIASKKNIQFILGNNKKYYFFKYSNIIFKILAVILLILGIAMLIKLGNPATLFMGISAGAMAIADKIFVKKEKEYNPHQVAEKGISVLDL